MHAEESRPPSKVAGDFHEEDSFSSDEQETIAKVEALLHFQANDPLSNTISKELDECLQEEAVKEVNKLNEDVKEQKTKSDRLSVEEVKDLSIKVQSFPDKDVESYNKPQELIISLGESINIINTKKYKDDNKEVAVQSSLMKDEDEIKEEDKKVTLEEVKGVCDVSSYERYELIKDLKIFKKFMARETSTHSLHAKDSSNLLYKTIERMRPNSESKQLFQSIKSRARPPYSTSKPNTELIDQPYNSTIPPYETHYGNKPLGDTKHKKKESNIELPYESFMTPLYSYQTTSQIYPVMPMRVRGEYNINKAGEYFSTVRLNEQHKLLEGKAVHSFDEGRTIETKRKLEQTIEESKETKTKLEERVRELEKKLHRREIDTKITGDTLRSELETLKRQDNTRVLELERLLNDKEQKIKELNEQIYKLKDEQDQLKSKLSEVM